MRRWLWLVLLLCLLSGDPSFADDATRVNLTADVVATSTAIAAGSSLAKVIDVGASEIQGVDWVMSSAAALNVQVQIRASNAVAGPFAYPTSVGSTTTTTTFTISTSPSATDVFFIPARYQQFTLVNNGAASVTVTRMTVFKF